MNPRRTLLLTFVVLVLASASRLPAQTVPPALIVQINNHSVPLQLIKLETNVRIFGPAAETTSTMTFSNPNARPMEGELYFPLPEGATISGYALDINGVMIDGVAVGKHDARRIFEEVERQGIDPGLVQWTRGNNFQTRVFPIPANGSRTIRVSYVSELGGGKESPSYHLPLAYKDKVGDFSLRIEVVRPADPPKITHGELANFQFAPWHESYVAETRLHDWSAVEDLVVALPQTDGPRALVEKADDDSLYFVVEDHPQRPAQDKEPPLAVSPRRVVVFWDASGSRTGDHGREIHLLCNYLVRLSAAKIDVTLVLFRNAPAAPQWITFDRDHQTDLVAALSNVQYDGGTQLGAIGPLDPDFTRGQKPDMYLLFTDGISNFGVAEPPAFDAPLNIFSAAASTEHSVLQRLAQSNGGQYFNLARWKDADVLAQAGRPVWSFLSAKVNSGTVEETYPKEAEPVGERFLLAGRLTDESAVLTLNYGQRGGQPAQNTVAVSSAHAVPGTFLRRLWAQKKLAQLMTHEKDNETEIAALGKKYGLVTPYTSLLVLESLEQYVQYEVAPPKLLASMRDEYMRRIDTVEHQKQKLKTDKLAEVLQMWQRRVAWWEADYRYTKDFKYKGEQVQKTGRALAGGGGMLFDIREDPRPSNGPQGAPTPATAAAAPAPAPATAPHAPVLVQEETAHAQAGRLAEVTRGLSQLRSDERGQEAAREEDRSQIVGAVRQLQARNQARERANENAYRSVLSRRQERYLGVNDSSSTGGRGSSQQPGIAIKPWQPDMPYLKELRAAHGKSEQFAVYMKNRAQYGATPAFYLDCADFFREAGQHELAVQVLSNIAELELEEASLLRVLAHRLEQIGETDLAVQTFEQVLHLRPEEPQSYRDLALALVRRGEVHGRSAEKVHADYARAVDLFVEVVNRRWDPRFPEIEVVALEELNHLIPRARAAGVSTIPLDPRLMKLLDFDVRIVMTWHADNTDIDLWVTEPTDEKAFYQHNRTTIGGLVSCDFTQGYGPEEYLVRRAAHGMYKIEANYFGTRATRLLGPVTVAVDVFTNYGRPNEQRKSMTLRLKDQKETVRIGEIEF